MTMFWVLLVLVILFVVGSASALRYFDHRRLSQKDTNSAAKKQNDQNSS